MASTDYLDDLRYCPDCGQPTTSSLQAWGNAVCDSTLSKVQCKPLTSRNFCGRCGKADPGAKCIGCSNAKRRWYQFEPSPAGKACDDVVKSVFANFSILEMPLILLCGVPVVVYTLWMYVEVLQFRSRSPMVYLAIFSAIAVASGAIYGLLRDFFRQSAPSTEEPVIPTLDQPDSRAASARLPVARVVNEKRDYSKNRVHSELVVLLLGAMLVIHVPAIINVVYEATMTDETRERLKQYEERVAGQGIN